MRCSNTRLTFDSPFEMISAESWADEEALMSVPYMRSSSCRAPLSLSAPATPPQRSVCSNTRGRTLVASRMTRAASPGRRFLSFRTGASGSLEDSQRRRLSELRRRSKTEAPLPAGSWPTPDPCTVACIKPLEPPPAAKPASLTSPPAAAARAPQRPEPDPASLNTKPSDIQVGGKQYTKVTGLTWVEDPQAGFIC